MHRIGVGRRGSAKNGDCYLLGLLTGRHIIDEPRLPRASAEPRRLDHRSLVRLGLLSECYSV